jgi:hypothetical protein
LNLHKALAAAAAFTGAGEESKPVAPIRFVFSGKQFLRSAGKEHLLQFYRRFIPLFNPSGEVGRKQDNSINVVRFGLRGNETAVDQKAASTDVPRQNKPAAEPENQPPAARGGGPNRKVVSASVAMCKPSVRYPSERNAGIIRSACYVASLIWSISP